MLQTDKYCRQVSRKTFLMLFKKVNYLPKTPGFHLHDAKYSGNKMWIFIT